MMKFFSNWLFKRKIQKVEKAFIGLREMLDKRDFEKFERRKIFKRLLRLAGFVHLRMREKSN